MLIRNHLDTFILALSDLNWNKVTTFGTIVITEMIKKLDNFQLCMARTVTRARKASTVRDKQTNCFKIMSNKTPQYFQTLIPETITFGTKTPQSRYPDNFYTMRARIETYKSSSSHLLSGCTIPLL